MTNDINEQGRTRVIIEGVQPEIDGGRFPIKRTVGEPVVVEADLFTDGHDAITGVLLYRNHGDKKWNEVPMTFLNNDRWRGEFTVNELGVAVYTVSAWVDHFKSWLHDLTRRAEKEDIALALLTGAGLVEEASDRASKGDATKLTAWVKTLKQKKDPNVIRQRVLKGDLEMLMSRYPDKRFATNYGRELKVVVDRELARFSAWYELFPRSCGAETEHGTFADCEHMLPYIAGMGFDIVYFPPIHPVGQTFRKGKNNSLDAGPDEPGSPWAIGSAEGGHKAVHRDLGTLKDFQRFIDKARKYKIEVALDIAFQCSPDHPYVQAFPDWFRWRPDGTVQYAENPPKKYQDIYPFNFETDGWQELWQELKSVFLFWVDQGVRVFRVDNPHTKPFPFWEWAIGEIKAEHPEVIFLAEAFTRPKVMNRLAKLGFTQSYTYFTWRNTKEELTQYFLELTREESREYFRPNLWPNTPDILHEYLQFGGRPAFQIRLALAATLGANYGIYGPAYELFANNPREPGSEEYLDSEKYQTQKWDLNRRDSLKDFIARVNSIRKENPALHRMENLHFFDVDNDKLICYSKSTDDKANLIIVVVNLDPYSMQSGWVELPLEELGLDPAHPYQMHDLLSDARYLWQGRRNYVELDPHAVPAHIFCLRRRVHTEEDFDYYL